MGYLIYTNRDNLQKTIRKGLIRIPQNLRLEFDLRRIKRGETIFFLDFDNNRLYGPALAAAERVIEEKNPKEGPFNGLGRVGSHYIYDSLRVDCSAMGKKGIKYKNPDTIKFILKEDEAKGLKQKLELVNTDRIPAVLNFTISEKSLKATVVKIDRGTFVNNYVYSNPNNLLTLLRMKKHIAEKLLISGNKIDFILNLKKMGQIIYDNILKPLDLETLFTAGGYTVYIAGDERIRQIPFEVSYNGEFIFERNTVIYSGEAGHDERGIKVKKVLIIADPSSGYENAYQEGLKLYRLLSEMEISIDFISRPMDTSLMNSFFADYDIVHFAGHTSIEKSKVGWDMGGSCFTVLDLLPQRKFPHLIFSSSCGNTLSLGRALMAEGVKNVIVSRWQMPDSDMSGFVLSFYNLLLSGIEIGDSFSSAVSRNYKRGEVTPILFTLYGESRMIYEKQNS